MTQIQRDCDIGFQLLYLQRPGGRCSTLQIMDTKIRTSYLRIATAIPNSDKLENCLKCLKLGCCYAAAFCGHVHLNRQNSSNIQSSVFNLQYICGLQSSIFLGSSIFLRIQDSLVQPLRPQAEGLQLGIDQLGKR